MSDIQSQNGYSRTAGDLPPGMSGIMPRPPLGGTGEKQTSSSGTSESGTVSAGDAWALRKAVDIYTNSTDYLNSNITLGWERNLYHFHNQHGPGSPYVSRDWKRSRVFRPKTRSNIKAAEAAIAAATFSTQEFVDIQPMDPTNPEQKASADINKQLLQVRLEKDPFSWFLTVVGQFQTTKVYGLCISHQYWRYETSPKMVPMKDDQGQPITNEKGERMGREDGKTIHFDKPCIDPIPPECFRFDPMCDWRNPSQSSPYLLYMWGLYAGEALALMEKTDPKSGQPAWRPYELNQILSSRKENVDNRTRRAREGQHRIDPVLQKDGDEFTMVWAHLNVLRVQGVDLAWWTLGTELVLTDPMPLTEMYPHLMPGERPFTVGFSTVEAFRNYPTGDVGQSAPIQEEINTVANQRLDNVKLVLNKRYFIRRGSQVDLEALMRNVPGGGVMVNDPEKDVEVIATPDVTGSSYQEHDRLSNEMDELVGGFSQAALAQNKNINESKGGVDRMAGTAGSVQDYGIKIFFETWMEPVLRQMVRMEQMYETDDVILAVAAKKAGLYDKYGINAVTDRLLDQDLTTRINVGLGNTDPMQRVQKLVFAVSNTMQLPEMGARLKTAEVADEIFGALGYKDASRFYRSDEEQAQYEKDHPPQPPPEIAVKMEELKIRDADNKARDKRETQKDQDTFILGMTTNATTREIAMDKLMHYLGIKKEEIQTLRDTTALKEANRLAEINMQRHDNLTKPPPAPPAAGGGKPPPKKGPPK